MIVATTVTAIGLFAVATVTQIFGYRLMGTITIPVLAIYTLKNVIVLPIFAFSTVLAYVGLKLLKERTLIYGRDELLAAILIGSAIPLLLLLALGSVLTEALRALLFVGSILPGLAAFNLHQLKPQYRKWDFATTVVLFLVLFVIGALLVSPTLRPVLGTLTPPLLYSETADIALWRDAVVVEPIQPMILDRPTAIGILGLALVASEGIRRRYDVRTGVIAVGLLAIYVLWSTRLIVLYLLLFVITFAAVQAIHENTILYGRVLIGLSSGFSLLAALPLIQVFPIEFGLATYFVAIFAGINAYNMHATAPAYRILVPPLQLATFLALVAIARVFTEPRTGGALQQFGVVEVILGTIVAVLCIAFAELYTVPRPSEHAVYDASILSGKGDE